MEENAKKTESLLHRWLGKVRQSVKDRLGKLWQRLSNSELIESYRSIFSGAGTGQKSIFLRIIDYVRRYIKSSRFQEILYKNLVVWVLIVVSTVATVSLVLSILGYGFAQIGVCVVSYIWDYGVLGLYAMVQFQHTWWILLPALMAIVWVIIRPTVLPWKGGWRKRFWALTISYTIFFTLFIVFSWQFQADIQGPKWFAVVGIFIGTHFMFLLSIAIVSSITTRIPPLNKKYVEITQRIIETEEDPVKYTFEMSLYGSLIMGMASDFFEGTIGQVYRKLNIKKGTLYNKGKKVFCSILYYTSFAWLFDKILGAHYYVKHFEMVLKYKLNMAELRSMNDLTEEEIHPALMDYAIEGILVAKTDEGETIKAAEEK